MKTNRHLIISGILFTIVLFLWPVFMVISQPSGNDEEQFYWIVNHLSYFRLQFLFAFLISPSVIYMMISQLGKYPSVNNIAMRTGLVFLTGYAVLSSIAYGSQMIVVPKLITAGLTEHAKIWYMGSSVSIIYFFNQLGYFFWAAGALILFVKLTRENGMIRYLAIIYIISAVLSVIAFIGLIMDNNSINSMTLYSGIALVPTGIITTIWGIREKRG